MKKNFLWQDPDFPHFYCNEAVVAPLEKVFKKKMGFTVKMLGKKSEGVGEVLTEEILANSEIEGAVFLLFRQKSNAKII